MKTRDSWGLDPAVKRLRAIFARLETRQAEVLARLTIAPLDPRVRPARELARRLWEGAWARADGLGTRLNDSRSADLYEYALLLAFERQGIPRPNPADWPEKELRELIEEVPR